MGGDGTAILLVSEDPHLLSLVPAIEGAGVAVAVVPNVFEAIVAFSSRPAEAVLIDLRDVDPRGLEIVPAIRKIAPATPVILLFSPVEREALAHGIALGASGALPKPFYVSEALALARRPAPPRLEGPPQEASGETSPRPVPEPAPPREAPREAPPLPAAPSGNAPSGAPLSADPLELLAGGVAHEINNPLAIISGWLQMLKSEAAPDDPRHRTYAIVLDEVERIASIVRDLLRFSLREAPRLAPLEIEPLLREAAAFAGEDESLAHLVVRTDAEPGLPPVSGDREQLRDVFRELVRNAGSATRGRAGHLSIRARRAGSDPGRVEISFEDDGPGVPASHVPRVFEPFFSTFSGPGRRGLGLSMARGVARAHGGDLAIEPAGGLGCRVRITLAVAPPVDAAAVGAGGRPGAAGAT